MAVGSWFETSRYRFCSYSLHRVQEFPMTDAEKPVNDLTTPPVEQPEEWDDDGELEDDEDEFDDDFDPYFDDLDDEDEDLDDEDWDDEDDPYGDEDDEDDNAYEDPRRSREALADPPLRKQYPHRGPDRLRCEPFCIVAQLVEHRTVNAAVPGSSPGDAAYEHPRGSATRQHAGRHRSVLGH